MLTKLPACRQTGVVIRNSVPARQAGHTYKGRFPHIRHMHPDTRESSLISIIIHSESSLQQKNALFRTLLSHFNRPDRGLDFADMYSSEQQHA